MSRHSLRSAMVSFLFVVCLVSAAALAATPGQDMANQPSSQPAAPKAGTYTGVVNYPEAGLYGKATLTVADDGQFTLTSDSTTLNGRFTGVHKGSVGIRFEGSHRAFIGAQVSQSGNNLSLKTAPDFPLAFAFLSGTTDARRVEQRDRPMSHRADVTSIAFSPDGSRIASGSYGEIFLWDTAHKGVVNSLSGIGDKWVSGIAFSPDKSTLAVATEEGDVALYNAATGTDLRVLSGANGILTLAFSPDSKTLAGVNGDGALVLLDLGEKHVNQTVPGEGGGFVSVAFSPDGKLAASSKDGTITLWDAARTQKKSWKGSEEPVGALAFSSNGALLASGGQDKSVQLWDVSKPEPSKRFTLPGHTAAISALAFSRDGRTVASVSADKKIKLWDVASGRLRQDWDADSEVISAAFSPKSNILATGYKDGNMVLWEVR